MRDLPVYATQSSQPGRDHAASLISFLLCSDSYATNTKAKTRLIRKSIRQQTGTVASDGTSDRIKTHGLKLLS